MNPHPLFQPYRLKSLELKNRIVMAPMTRSFSPDGVPTSNVAGYYVRRVEGEVGLILSEGTVVNRPASSNDPGIPRFYGEKPLLGWKGVIDKVHAAGGAMAPQLWHMGVVAPHASSWLPSAPFDSRDLDQLTVAESLDGGRVRMLVAVADVDALVPKNSAIDDHAACNTTSVYTPAVMFPMLPLPLSFDLTSLNEGEDRIAVVTDMVFDAEGGLVTADHYRANVRNHAKLAYRSVGMWLAGDGPIPEQILKVPGLDANLRLQDSIARLLADLREHHGALSLVTIEPRAMFDGDVISALEPNWKNRATQLIEDFMIAANGANATYLAAKNFPSIRRVLRSPERWDRIVKLGLETGEHLPVTPDAVALETFLVRQSKAAPETFADLSLAVVKLIGRGEYALDLPGGEPPGHFALAVRDYTHSTAPNRRFPDLITQRLLKAAMAGAPLPYTIMELEELAKHCTDREDDVTKVERRMRKSAAALLLSGRIGQSFEAVVTGASERGTWVRLFQPPIEGRLEQGFQGLDVGDPVSVKLVHTDTERGFIDFVRD